MLDNRLCSKCPLESNLHKFNTQSGHPVDILFVLEAPNINSATYDRLMGGDMGSSALIHLIREVKHEFTKRKKKIYTEEKIKNMEITHAVTYTTACNLDAITDKTLVQYDKKNKIVRPKQKLVDHCHGMLFNSIERVNPKVIVPVGDVPSKALNLIFKKFRGIVS